MATNVKTSPDTIAREFADAILHEPGAERLWLHTHRDYLELWLMTSPLDMDAEHRFFERWADLVARHPQAHIRLHVINPSFYEDGIDLMNFIPALATPIALHI